MFTVAKSRFHSLVTAATTAMCLCMPLAAAADITMTGFRQAVAEAAARDEALAAFYRGTDFDGFWTGADRVAQDRRNALLTVLSEAAAHGLPTSEYDPTSIIADLRAATTPAEQGRMDVELSRIFLAYAQDVHSGILVPGDVVTAIRRDAPVLDNAELLAGLATANSPEAFLRGLAPDAPEYARLMRQKLLLEQVIETAAWGSQVPGDSYAPGDSGQGVVALRNRLMAMGYLDRSVTSTYDNEILAAVQAFQSANGMTADGVAGPATLREINTPATQRLESVLVAMERERWINFDRGDRHIWVNLTDFTANVVDFDRVTFTTRSVIGALGADRESPEFSDVMTHMVINPSWFVPRSITVNEYLPALQANPGAHGYMQVVDSRGRVVDRSTADFSRYTASTFPFSMRQPPSPRNALGQVKFMFPNQWNIYLHDTPAQSLFQRDVRAFSHGCIRLDDPFDFAYHLLAEQNDDPVGFFQAYLRSGNETRVDLDTPLPVHLVYRTAFTNVEGELQFREDIYGRDTRIWRALNAAGVTVPGVQG